MTTFTFSRPDNSAKAEPPRLRAAERRRAVLRLGWYLHALVFVLVNLGLAASTWLGHGHVAGLPSPGWALGLSIHGLVVLLVHLRPGLVQRMVRHERALRNMG